ncbi:hypothetical protein JCM15765_12390 [Paradesulfitobacterium aromaticivorans]
MTAGPLTTANFDFAEFLRIGRTVRAALGPEAVLVANTGDFGREGAEALRRVGFQGVYHALRLGEGKVSRSLSRKLVCARSGQPGRPVW